MKRAVVAGHICIDITPKFPEDKRVPLQKLLQPGKLITAGDAEVSAGGCVANTGRAMRILGADTVMLAKAGQDVFGRILGSIIGDDPESVRIIRTDEAGSSYTVVLAVPGNDRVFIHNSGANDVFCAADIPEDLLEDCTLFHFGYPPLMAKMYQDEGRELEEVFAKAKRFGAVTSLDMAEVDPHSPAGRADWDAILKRTLPLVDLFVPSIGEVCYMLDREKRAFLDEQAAGGDLTDAADLDRDIRPLARKCLSYGAKAVLIKCGAAGMYLAAAGEEAFRGLEEKTGISAARWAGRDLFEDSYVPDRVLSGTGAGDTSIAAFLTAFMDGADPEDCLHLAAAAGACCVAGYDSLGELVPMEQLKARIAAGWEKQRSRFH